MKKNNKKFYITTPIYYVNDKPHIGHAYTTIAADILARYHRMIGDKTFFLTGTDEHGAKIEEKAKELGMAPKQFVDEITAKFQLAWDELNISNDRFIRTTEEEHRKAVRETLEYMYDKGDIYKGEYRGLYCQKCEQYKNEKDLVDGKCPDHQTTPEKMSEECYIFRMSKYEDELLKRIKSDEFKILPIERKNEIVSFYKNEKLRDVSFSRKNVKWGIPLPWDKSHTTYVWADAFLNYLTGLGWQGPKNKLPEMWPADVHLMSKDILRVHATIWPAMLLSLDIPLPKSLFIHGFFLVDGQKMSKSLGNVIAPEDLIKKYGVDATRYLLMSATTFGHDGDIGWKKFDEKYNADLANGLGNLVARILTLVEKSGIESLSYKEAIEGSSEEILKQLKGKINNTWVVFNDAMENLKIHQAVETTWSLISFIDGYLDKEKPWELITKLIENEEKELQDELEIILYNLIESLRQISWLIWPFMPETAESILKQLGILKIEQKKTLIEAQKWPKKWMGMIKKGRSLFPRI